MTVIEALTGLGFAASNKEARRKIDEGAVRIDGERISDPRHPIGPLSDDQALQISLGAKKHGRIIPAT